MNHRRIFSICCILTILMISAGAALAGKDTPDIVMNTYKAGATDTADLLAVSNEANSFVIKEAAPRSTVQILKVDPDFTIAAEFSIRKYKVVICASSETNCNGSHFLLTIS